MLNPLSSNNDDFVPTSRRQLKTKLISSSMRLYSGRVTSRRGHYIVLVLKNNEKIRVCIDFRDLNATCPKDEFLLPISEFMIDNIFGFKRMSFMDGFSGYNQIKLYPDDEKHTSFRTPL